MNKALVRFSTLIMLLLGVIPTVHLLLEGFGLTADDRLPYFLVVACVFSWLMFSFKRLSLPGILAFTALVALFIQGRWQLLLLQVKDAADRMAGAYVQHFVTPAYDYSGITDSHTELLLLFGLLLSALLCLGLNSKEERVVLSSLPVATPVLLCLMVCGDMPAWIMFCLSLYVFMLLCTGRCYSADSNSGRAFFVLLLPVAAILSLLLIWKGPSSYHPQEQDMSLVQQLQDLLRSAAEKAGLDPQGELPQLSSPPQDDAADTQLWSGSGGRLDASLPIDESSLATELLKLRAQETGRIYLRACSYGDSLGTGWGTAPVYPGGSALPFASYAVEASGGEKRSMDIQLVNASDSRLYVPYYSMKPYDGDAQVADEGQSYYLDYFSLSGGIRDLQLPSELKDKELSYRQYVYSNYLRLSKSTAKEMRRIAEEEGISTKDRLETIAQVAELVRGRCSYSISAAPWPGDDYATYFFRQANEGYCVHFTTAAVSMYRALGIPARAVTGLAVDAKAGQYVPVYRRSEHAWAEVYIDGVGWLPVEVTPSSSGEDPGLTELAPSPSPIPIPSPYPQTPEPDRGGQGSSTTPSTPSAELPSAAQPKPAWLFWLLPPFMLLALFGLWQLRKKLYSVQLDAAGAKGAMAVWRRAKKICAFGADMPEHIELAAQRVCFGPGDIDEALVKDARKELLQLRAAVYLSLPWYKKILFRIVKGL